MQFGRKATIEGQLAALAEMGLKVNEGVTIEDITTFYTRQELEAKPYAGLIEALGWEIEREPFTPKCDQLWMCDYECIEDDGDYKRIIERLELMTGSRLKLAEISDFVDIEQRKAWVEFKFNGKVIRWDAKVEDDWLDPYIVLKYDALLKETGSSVRIYSNHTDYGQVALFAAFSPEQKRKFDKLSKIKLELIESQG